MSVGEPFERSCDPTAGQRSCSLSVGQLRFTTRQQQLVRQCGQAIRRSGVWQGSLPVLLLDRCWMRLNAVPVEELASRLPPDCSREAPELVHYRQLLAAGHPPLEAEQLCWRDFGMEACRQAQRRFWLNQERGNHDWTLDRYLALLQQYRQRVESGSGEPLPLLVLARPAETGPGSRHTLLWLGPQAG